MDNIFMSEGVSYPPSMSITDSLMISSMSSGIRERPSSFFIVCIVVGSVGLV